MAGISPAPWAGAHWWPPNSTRKRVAGSGCSSSRTSWPGTAPMLSKRIIPCLDVREGRTTKGIKFLDNVDVGDPVAMAQQYYEAGADELVFYDITASSDRRNIMIEVVDRVAAKIFIPFSVGGGIRNLEDMRAVLLAGAEKVSVNTAAGLDPGPIAAGAQAF